MAIITQTELGYMLGGVWVNMPDDVATLLIAQAQSLAEQHLGSQFDETSHTAEQVRVWDGAAVLDQYPATDVVVTYDSTDITADFRVYEDHGYLVADDRWFTDDQVLSVAYTGGYGASHPKRPGVQMAVGMIAARLYRGSQYDGAQGVKRKELLTSVVEYAVNTQATALNPATGLTAGEEGALEAFARRFRR